MTISALSFYLIPGLSLIVSTALLALQLRMFLRHRHISFLLLFGGTLCALIYVLCLYSLSYYFGRGDPLPDSFPVAWPYVAPALQVAALLLGLWGTASLFNAYNGLSAARGSGDV